MTEVDVFFYGSYMNPKVLAEVELRPERLEPARLGGFRLVIEPRANLVPSERSVAYGVVTRATHAELERLYAHARDVLGEVYLPEAVLVATLDGAYRTALCYLCHDMEPRPAAPDYVDRMLAAAREHRFPDWYLGEIESFKMQS